MIFPAIDHVIKKGGRVAVVSPRIDVILELAPRLRKAFSKLDLVLLYGDTPEEYHYTKLVLATTHQLLKFSQAFDLLIIDEVDSFPFHGDLMLESAALRARKKIASTIYLTATPTKKLINDYRKKRLDASFLPLRFHQHLLPELTFSRIGDWRKQIIKNRLPRKLKIQIEKYQKSGQRFLLFVPKVSDLKNTLETIESFSEIKGLSVHTADPERKSKVQQMRDRKIQFLVTTTILERGVTFPGIDVIILGADNQFFSVNAIVQIAGRVGRNKDRPSGLVLALIEEKTQVLIRASRQIRFMNEKGLKQLNNVQ
ncbi:DEAD/DEAH box helicase [Oenococcus oeni IOEB_0607]|nr:DEAD/DEAH box helicase [Oenococcus oeni IOEB_0607]